MKKNYLLSLLLILVVFFVIYSCRKENTQSESNSLTDPNAAMDKKQAQNYYYNILMKQPGTSTATTNGIQTTDVNTTAKRNWKYLMFDLSYTSQTPNVTFIEIPLRYNQRPSTLITKDAVTAASPAQLNILNAGYDRLLIYKNKSTGQIDQTIVTFIPDSAYLQKHHNDISSNHIDKLDADFNGFLLYKKWDGTPTYLLTVHNGVYTNNYNFSTTPISVNNTGKLMTDALPKNSTFAVICVGYWVQPMIEHCWASDPEGPVDGCSGWVPDGPPYWVNLYCYDDGSAPPPPQPPSILPAPPAGSTPVVVPTPTSTADHKLPHPNTLPPNPTSDTQVGHMCTLKVMQWVSSYFGGTLSVGQALLQYMTDKNFNMGQAQNIINTATKEYQSLLNLLTDVTH